MHSSAFIPPRIASVVYTALDVSRLKTICSHAEHSNRKILTKINPI